MSKDLKNIILDAIPANSKVLIAVSGGVDSVALFDLINKVKGQLALKVLVAHVNHKLRPDSDRDQSFVEKLADSANCKFFCKVLNPDELDSRQNIESWARSERYKFFSKIISEENCDWIITAHHADDAIETFFIRLLANKELKGIAYKDPLRKVIRPLLSVQKQELISYANSLKLEFVEDSTNHELNFTRNRIRNLLLPYIYQNFSETSPAVLSKRIAANNEDLEYFSRAILNDLSDLNSFEFESKQLLNSIKNKLATLDSALSWRLVDEFLKNKLGFNIGRLHAQRVIEFLLSNQARIELPSGAALLRKNGGIIFEINKS